MNHRSRTTLILGLFVAAVLATAGCTAPAPPEVRIGVIAPLTGELETIGQSTERAVRLIEATVNEQGGLAIADKRLHLELVIIDDQSRSEPAVEAARRLINQENVVAIVGPQSSSNAIPAGEVAERAHIPLISPGSTNPATTMGRDYVFRVGFLDTFQGQALAALAGTMGAATVAILYDETNDYSVELAKVFAEAFPGTVESFRYNSDTRDISAALERIRVLQPDLIFLPNFPDHLAWQAARIREVSAAQILGSDTWGSLKPEDRALPALQGAIFTTHYTADNSSPQNQQFIAAYQKMYGELPSDDAALTYDALHLILAAIADQQSTDPAAIQRGLHRIEHAGVTGTIRYRASGDPEKSIVVLSVKDGQFHFSQTIDPQPAVSTTRP